MSQPMGTPPLSPPPPPAFNPEPLEPLRRSNTGLIIGIVVAVFICCCCLALAFYGWRTQGESILRYLGIAY